MYIYIIISDIKFMQSDASHIEYSTDEKRLRTNHQRLILRIDLVKEDAPMQSLLFNLRVLRQNFPHVCHDRLQNTSLPVTDELEQCTSASICKQANRKIISKPNYISNCNEDMKLNFQLTVILLTSRWLIPRCVLIRQ